MPSTDPAAQKVAAARAAVELVGDGMLVGLGSGTTAAAFVDLLAERVRSGLRITAVPTSRAIAAQAEAGGITIAHDIDRELDIAVDGADEIDARLNLVKGRGGALVREKLVAASSRRFVVIADATKLVDRLGAGPVPIEVVPFLWPQTARRLELLGLSPTLRGGEAAPFVSDNGNLILDCAVPGGIADPAAFGAGVRTVIGVVDHGVFAGMADRVLVADGEGVRSLDRAQ